MSGSKTVKAHEAEYWHVPKFGLLPLVGVLFFGFLAWVNFGLLDWGFLDVEIVKSFVFSDLVLVYPFIGECCFVSGFVISLVALVKGGYKNLKTFKEKDLIWGLIWGLILALIWDLSWGLIWAFDKEKGRQRRRSE